MHAKKKKDCEPREKKTKLNFLVRFYRFIGYIFFSSLLRRIVILNLAALTFLVGGIMFLNQFRNGLVDAKIESFYTQGQIIAGAIAASATVDENVISVNPKEFMKQKKKRLKPKPTQRHYEKYWAFSLNPERVSALLRHVISSRKTRARIFDTDGKLLIDSRWLYLRGQNCNTHMKSKNREIFDSFFRKIYTYLAAPLCCHKDYSVQPLVDSYGVLDKDIISKLKTGAKAQVRHLCNNSRNLDVSVSVPIRKNGSIVGILILSNVGSDIEDTIYAERMAIFRLGLIVAIVILFLSAFLSYTIANPLRRLSEAANHIRKRMNKRIVLPDFSKRQDEIGDLYFSIHEMTDAFYKRIEAIESFAADVSHELKNPLTSLNSAVETLPLVKDEKAKERLYEIITHDIKRLDRLITDISSASRVDAELAREACEFVDMENLLENYVSSACEVQKGKSDLEIIFSAQPLEKEKNYIVSGHDLRLGQVISNLLANAQSFVPKKGGKIKIYMKRLDDTICITVEDNGPGIQVENINSIFERFYTDRPASEGFGQNSGLGLSISRQIIEIHGGTLTAENIIDPKDDTHILGARFKILLPAIC